MAKVTGLGRFGMYVRDLPRMTDFYTNILGMTVTDRTRDGLVFLSARPEQEHHEITLAQSIDQKTDAGQVSFHVDSLQALKALYRRIKAYGCQFDRVVTHGIAFGAYFRDPEGNRIEIYWETGIDYPQPFGEPIDLEAPDAELLNVLENLPPRQGSGPHLYGKDVGKRLTAAPVGVTDSPVR